MKKFLVAFAILLGTIAQAQRGNQEFSVDLTDALILKTLELNYEYYLNSKSSIGISGLFNFEKQSADFSYNEKNMFTPYFRHYFTTNENWNYFGEIFLGINSGKDRLSNGSYKDYTDGALGISIGSKYISSGGFMVSVLGGIGRNMFTDKSPIIVPRVGLNVGFRF